MTNTDVGGAIQRVIDSVAPQIKAELEANGFERNVIFITERPVFQERRSGDLYLVDVRVEGLWGAHVVPRWLAAGWSGFDEEDIADQDGVAVVIQYGGTAYLTGFPLREVGP